MSTTTFAAVSAVKQRAERAFDVDLSPSWTIGGRPNGGYLLAAIGRAAGVAGPHPDVLAASAHYLRSPEPGPAEVEIEPLRAGRGASQVRGRLLKDGVVCVEALLTLGTLPDEGSVRWDGGLPDPRLTDPAGGVRIPSGASDGFTAAIFGEIDARLDPDSARAFTQGPRGLGELRGWLALPGDEPFDPVSLLFAVDSFPPATFDIAPSGWVPTLELTAYLRARPAPGPVRVLHRAHLIADDRVDESCFIWDRTGRLVAQSTQLAGIRMR
ncbi:thioesterase family protein [Amycolatopsis sp. PS_44_ISF1]|uniref:thioesterase family protein n=1 Tax=Amycolatopsis sp. PS_44_ISF1 TaxID=2974917 RepID=UPI0028DFA00B|nr:thioesterase family protein [Amycolatopsis sp. PS_44_ISF1]MDT8913386.1 thioesterase family protein [Amycolatopsis sp. PS_44_ISF1]